LNSTGYKLNSVIDTCGFEIQKSRRVINIGHGWEDGDEYSKETKIFGVEGACPVFRREALNDAVINGRLIDQKYFWYGDDLDLAWRLQILGWDQIFIPSMIAWHDRQTTKRISGSKRDFIKMRREIPAKKRRLDWRNVRFTIIKNDYIINILRDLPYVLRRELSILGYMILFEPSVLLEIPVLIKNIPSLLKDRREIMKKAKRSAEEMRSWYA
jgi:GT2 family glycosyltransferase